MSERIVWDLPKPAMDDTTPIVLDWIEDHQGEQALLFVPHRGKTDDHDVRRIRTLNTLKPVDTILADFDNTLSLPPTQWHALESWLEEKADDGWRWLKHLQKLRKDISGRHMRTTSGPDSFWLNYREDVNRRLATYVAWTMASVMALPPCEFNKAHLPEVAPHIQLRPGFDKLFRHPKINRFLTCSMGVLDILDQVFRDAGYGDLRDNGTLEIAAAKMCFDNYGRFTFLDPTTIVAGATKGSACKAYHHARGTRRSQALCLFDSRMDTAMIQHGALSIGVFAPEDPEDIRSRLNALEDLLPFVDLLLVGDSLEPVAELLTLAHES